MEKERRESGKPASRDGVRGMVCWGNSGEDMNEEKSRVDMVEECVSGVVVVLNQLELEI